MDSGENQAFFSDHSSLVRTTIPISVSRLGKNGGKNFHESTVESDGQKKVCTRGRLRNVGRPMANVDVSPFFASNAGLADPLCSRLCML